MKDELSKGERTRKSIIDAAHQLFIKQGYHGTSIRQISEKANITLGGIYNHFSSKDDLFEAVIIEYHPVYYVIPNLQSISGDSIEDYIRHAGHVMHDHLSQRDDFFNLLFIEIVEFKGRHFPKLFSKVFPIAVSFTDSISKKKGYLRKIPKHAMVVCFVGMILASYLFQKMLITHNVQSFPSINIDSILDIFLHGIIEKNPD